MKNHRISMTLAALVMSITCAHASTASSAFIYFTGRVYLPASASMTFHSAGQQVPQRTMQTYSLDKAQKLLQSHVLDFYASYAPKNAIVISSTYQ
ncbi:MAG TPA: hypothetical protein VME63_14045 [Dyella sp.]|uniref:hypothetical protein n=1 Tax=Dyella sp. TaxID=1869338 RepID=UPI002D129542|nr:hypothetical protein [Dyella sp.]HTV86520.1 hypothetical protein [Dyella sp.]